MRVRAAQRADAARLVKRKKILYAALQLPQLTADAVRHRAG
jgi:hypothetical protein